MMTHLLASSNSPLISANQPAFQSYLTAHPCAPRAFPGAPFPAPAEAEAKADGEEGKRDRFLFTRFA